MTRPDPRITPAVLEAVRGSVGSPGRFPDADCARVAAAVLAALDAPPMTPFQASVRAAEAWFESDNIQKADLVRDVFEAGIRALTDADILRAMPTEAVFPEAFARFRSVLYEIFTAPRGQP